MNDQEIAERVQALLQHKGWSARELARRAGVSASTGAAVARGDVENMQPRTGQAISRAFGWPSWDEMIASTELEPPVRGEIVPAPRDAIVPVFQYFRGAILTARSLVDKHPEAAKQALSAALSGWPEDDNDDDHLTPPFLKDNSQIGGWAAVTGERQLALA